MILTFTPNPAVDKTIFMQSIALGAVNRVKESQLDPGGKGINVSRMVNHLEWPTMALGFLAGDIGHLVQTSLSSEGVPNQFVFVPGQTRLNITIMDETTQTGTSFFDEGPFISPSFLEAMDHIVAKWLRTAQVFVLAGALPPGLPQGVYATYIQMARSKGVTAILDAHGEPLKYGIGALPYLIKPNVSEAEELLERKLPTEDAIIAAAKELRARGIAVVVISMGAKGAICANSDVVWKAIPPKVEPKSTVGSGDSMVAGLAIAIAQRQNILEGLRLGTAAGAATAMTPGTSLGTLAEVKSLLGQVKIEQID